MNTNKNRILGIALLNKGFGFALLERDGSLVDWGFKWVRGDKNKVCIKAITEMIEHCAPDVIALHDYTQVNARRSPRVRRLGRALIQLAQSHAVEVAQLSRETILKAFLLDKDGTKYAVAEKVAERFAYELAHWLPPKRKCYEGEDYWMGIFDAVALGLVQRTIEANCVRSEGFKVQSASE